MNKKMMWKEAAGVVSVVLVIAAVPLLLWYWHAVHVPAKYPPGTKIIHLTPMGEGGFWTQDNIVGFAYWWRKPKPVQDIHLTRGDHVVLLLHSSDVQHSISIPDLGKGTVQIPAGHTVELEFDADKVGELDFYCTQVCGRNHSRLAGRFIISEPGDAGNQGATSGQSNTHTHHEHGG